jgi:hypothetical protein
MGSDPIFQAAALNDMKRKMGSDPISRADTMEAVRWLWLACIACAGCRFHFDDRSTATDDSLRAGPLFDGDGDGSSSSTPAVVYAATQSQMYRIDQQTLLESTVMPLCSNVGGFQISDLAVSSTGQIFVSDMASPGFQLADATGNCTLIRTLAVRMYGLAFVPPGVMGPSEQLLGAGDNGNLYRVDTATGTLQLVGPFGNQPGDLAWTGTQLLGTVQVNTSFHLGVVNTTTGAVADLGDTTYTDLYGLVFSNGKLYAFSATAGTIELDPATGGTIRSRMAAPAWYGASGGP